MRIVLFLVGMISGGSALAMWAEVLGVAGLPEGGGPGLAVMATVLSAIAIGAFLGEQRLRKGGGKR